MSPKRRWVLAVVSVVLPLVLFVGGTLMQEPKDAPRVTVLGTSYQNGIPILSLRLHAPRRRAMQVVLVGAEEVDAGHDGPSVVWLGSDSPPTPVLERFHHILQRRGSPLPFPPRVEAGASAQYDVDWVPSLGPPPIPEVHRLGVLVNVEKRAPLKRRLELCWQYGTLNPLLGKLNAPHLVLLYTQPVTNAVPNAADAPRP